MSEILDQARKYEKEECGKIKKESRPAFHFSNPCLLYTSDAADE